jgi:hypothetical protein
MMTSTQMMATQTLSPQDIVFPYCKPARREKSRTFTGVIKQAVRKKERAHTHARVDDRGGLDGRGEP